MDPTKPVNQEAHERLVALNFKFIHSRWENEFAVSEYLSPDGNTLRVEQSGRMLWGKAV